MRKIIFYTLFIASVALSSCQKDIDVFVPDPSANLGTWYNTIDNTMPVADLKLSLRLPIYKDSFSVNSLPASPITGSGLQCYFPPGSIVSAAGQPVIGTVNIETYLLKSRGDMIKMNTPTTSGGRLLVSGGELFIRLMQNGSELQLAQQNNHYFLDFADPQPSPLMRLFTGDESNPAAFNWLPLADTINSVIASGQTYSIRTNQLHWINCDYFFDTTGIPQTIVSANLPANFTNANSMAFISFNDMRSVVSMQGNVTTRKFSSGRLPANRQITVVIISKQGNDYYLGHEQALTAGSSTGTQNSQEVTVTPVLTSLDNIKTYLNSL